MMKKPPRKTRNIAALFAVSAIAVAGGAKADEQPRVGSENYLRQIKTNAWSNIAKTSTPEATMICKSDIRKIAEPESNADFVAQDMAKSRLARLTNTGNPGAALNSVISHDSYNTALRAYAIRKAGDDLDHAKAAAAVVAFGDIEIGNSFVRSAYEQGQTLEHALFGHNAARAASQIYDRLGIDTCIAFRVKVGEAKDGAAKYKKVDAAYLDTEQRRLILPGMALDPNDQFMAQATFAYTVMAGEILEKIGGIENASPTTKLPDIRKQPLNVSIYSTAPLYKLPKLNVMAIANSSGAGAPTQADLAWANLPQAEQIKADQKNIVDRLNARRAAAKAKAEAEAKAKAAAEAKTKAAAPVKPGKKKGAPAAARTPS